MEEVFASNDRLLLRKAKQSDVADVFELLKDPEVNTFLPWFPLTSLQETHEFMEEYFFKPYEKQQGFHSVICMRNNDKVIGYVHMSGEESHDFGYAIAKEYWHQGIASQASALALDYLRQQNISYITATHDVRNPNSGKVMEKLGMNYCYTYEEQWMPKNKVVHFRMYQLNLDGKQCVYQAYRTKYKAWEETITKECKG